MVRGTVLYRDERLSSSVVGAEEVPPMKKSEKRSKGGGEIVDLELNCLSCGGRLYTSVESAMQIFATVQSGGIGILICPCGQVQSIQRKWKRKTHD
jgi:hypothetical protein